VLSASLEHMRNVCYSVLHRTYFCNGKVNFSVHSGHCMVFRGQYSNLRMITVLAVRFGRTH
jgi:hypothetical protein